VAEKLLDLGQGLELWQVDVDELREQDKNAQQMDPAMFTRLEDTVGRDHRLEQLPFCALTEKGIEVVSGHHRTRAARAAGVRSIYVLVDTTGLTDDQIKAKQLAHNAISGRSDPQLVREIYESIQDTDARLEAFVDPKELDLDLESLSTGNVNVDFDHRTIVVSFLPSEKERFERALEKAREQLPSDMEAVYLADIELAELFLKLTAKTSEALDVRAMGTVLGVIADIVLEQLGDDELDEGKTERVHLSQVVKQAYIPRSAASTIERALDRLESDGAITKKNRWQGLEYMAAEYLGGA
jgi:ParB-like chromosome segregation protein Spo0J